MRLVNLHPTNFRIKGRHQLLRGHLKDLDHRLGHHPEPQQLLLPKLSILQGIDLTYQHLRKEW
jgi:hypothetical protein